jgi:hypothetical protein
MKKIEAIIQPYKLDDRKEALENLGVDGLTLTMRHPAPFWRIDPSPKTSAGIVEISGIAEATGGSE